MNLSILSLLLLIIFSMPVTAHGQLNELDLPDPVYVPSYNSINIDVFDRTVDAINEQNSNARNYAIKVLSFIHDNLLSSMDDQMSSELKQLERQLLNILERGSPRSHIEDFTKIATRVNSVLLSARKRAMEREIEAQKKVQEREFLHSMNAKVEKLLRGEEIKFIKNSGVFCSEERGEFIDYNFEDGIIFIKNENKSPIFCSFSLDVNYSDDFYYETYISLMSFKSIMWMPAAGIIYGANASSTIYNLLNVGLYNNKVQLKRFAFNRSSAISEELSTDFIKDIRSGNKIGILKSDNKLIFFLNNEIIFQSDASYIRGNRFGIHVDPGLTLLSEYVRLYKMN